MTIYGTTDGKRFFSGNPISLKLYPGTIMENLIMVSCICSTSIMDYTSVTNCIISQLGQLTQPPWMPWKVLLTTMRWEWIMMLGSCFFLSSSECIRVERRLYTKRWSKLGIALIQIAQVAVPTAQQETQLLSQYMSSFSAQHSCCWVLANIECIQIIDRVPSIRGGAR